MMLSISQRYVGKLLVTVFLKLLYLEYANTSGCLGPPLKFGFSFLSVSLIAFSLSLVF